MDKRTIGSAAIIPVLVLMLIPTPSLQGQGPAENSSALGDSVSKGITVMNVNSIVVDHLNIKWFSTDAGIVSFDGEQWKLYDGNEGLPTQDLKNIAYIESPEGPELWVASPLGATFVTLPMDEHTRAITYDPENTPILGKEVLGIAGGKDSTRWIATEKGIFALHNGKWLLQYYDLHYPERMFKVFPITAMVTNPIGDTLYAATEGAGIVRVYRDQLDAISGASVYAQWGPIDIPSDHIQSIYLAPDGAKWFGTKKGIARHTGNNTLENWKVYNEEDGLVDNFVQAICGDREGNIWFGTKGGISVFDGSSWVSYTMDNGLISNNILSLAMDHEGIIWIGTDEGISSCRDGVITNH
jgi:ligand-binding sensor domain-containing protein